MAKFGRLFGFLLLFCFVWEMFAQKCISSFYSWENRFSFNKIKTHTTKPSPSPVFARLVRIMRLMLISTGDEIRQTFYSFAVKSTELKNAIDQPRARAHTHIHAKMCVASKEIYSERGSSDAMARIESNIKKAAWQIDAKSI